MNLLKYIFKILYHNKKKFFSISGIILCLMLVTIMCIWSTHRDGKPSYQAFIIANHKLHKGESLTVENTKIAFLDLGSAHSYYVTHDEFENFDGTYLKDNICESCPILKYALTTSNDIQTQIPAGKRLFILDIPVGPILSLLKIGDIVDVIADINMPDFGNVTETILGAVKIISLGDLNDSFSQDNENKYLSFYLTPDEIKILSFIKPYATFSVVLRNASDTNAESTKPITLNQFFQNEKIKKIIEADSFKIINGTKIKRK